MAGARRKARVLAFQVLFEVDCTGHDPMLTLEKHQEEHPLGEEQLRFARKLVQGVVRHRKAIDARIAAAATNWPLSQMAVADRNVLRLAMFEVLFDNEVPLRAAINEAVELARSFGGENSPRFVNGVLGAVVAQQKGLSPGPAP